MRAKGDIVENPVYIPMDRRVEQFRSFYQRENERPLLGFFLGSEYPLFATMQPRVCRKAGI